MNNDQFELEECKYCGSLIPKGSYRCPKCGEKLKIDFKKALLIGGITFGVVSLFTAATLYIKTPRKIDLPDEELSTLEQGIESFNNGDYSDAEEIFNKAIEENKDPKAFFYLGKIKEHDNDMLDAIYNYKESLRLDPLNKQLKPYLVNLCIDSNDTECINEFISEAYAEASGNPKIALNYAISGNISQEDSFNILRNISSNNENEYYYANKILGFHYAYYNEYKNAIPYLQRAYKLRGKIIENPNIENYIQEKYYTPPERHEGHVLIACYVSVEQYTNAIKLLDELIAKGGDPELISLKEQVVQARDQYNAQRAYEKQQQTYQKQQESSSKSSRETTINGTKLKSKIATSADSRWASYMSVIQSRIKANWNPYKVGYPYSIKTNFKLDRNGDVVSTSIVSSSGIPLADKAALNAIQLTQFPPFPNWCDKDYMTIDFNFDCNE